MNDCNADEQSNSEMFTPFERKDVGTDLRRNIRSHPLFFGITLGLLAEIINSRYTTKFIVIGQWLHS